MFGEVNSNGNLDLGGARTSLGEMLRSQITRKRLEYIRGKVNRRGKVDGNPVRTRAWPATGSTQTTVLQTLLANSLLPGC